MSLHDQHNHCEHMMQYCAKCDVAYCVTCNREWKPTCTLPHESLRQYWQRYMTPDKVIFPDDGNVHVPLVDVHAQMQEATSHMEHH